MLKNFYCIYLFFIYVLIVFMKKVTADLNKKDSRYPFPSVWSISSTNPFKLPTLSILISLRQ